jgi:hypothetical protein
MFNIAARNLGLDRILVESHIPLNMDVRINSAGISRCVAMLMNIKTRSPDLISSAWDNHASPTFQKRS